MKKFVVFTMFVITVYQLDAQTKLITVEKGDTILVGGDMKIVIPAKRQLKKTFIRRDVEPKIINIQLPEYNNYPQLPIPAYPVRYQDQPAQIVYHDNHNDVLLALGILGLVCGMGAVVLVLSERGRRKDDYGNSYLPVNNTFHVSGGNVDSSKHEHNDLHDSRTYGEPDMSTANAVVKMWQKEKKENPYGRDDNFMEDEEK